MLSSLFHSCPDISIPVGGDLFKFFGRLGSLIRLFRHFNPQHLSISIIFLIFLFLLWALIEKWTGVRLQRFISLQDWFRSLNFCSCLWRYSYNSSNLFGLFCRKSSVSGEALEVKIKQLLLNYPANCNPIRCGKPRDKI